ncbi:MAG: ATP-binding protein [Deltaproteobacteria bacterium]|nr:ATP-binding protein [Deltaproteobacteria bacterium]
MSKKDSLDELTYAELLAIAKEAKRSQLIKFDRPWVVREEGGWFSGGSSTTNYPKAVLLPILKEHEKLLKELACYRDVVASRPADRSVAPGGGSESTPVDLAELKSRLFPGVVGLDELKSALIAHVYLPFTFRNAATALRVSMSPGLLLCGPPGGGKTFATRVFCESSGFYYSAITGTGLMSKWYGETEELIRKEFENAQRKAPAVLLIDELDAITPTRGSGAHHDVTPVNEFLSMLDGLRRRERVAVIATTNRLDAIDPAIRRSGRLGTVLTIANPGSRERAALLQATLRGLAGGPFDCSRVAAKLDGASRADITQLVADAGARAFVRHATTNSAAAIHQADLEHAAADLQSRIAGMAAAAN